MFCGPGTYFTLKLYDCNRNTHLSIRADGFDRAEYITSSCLWSVTSSNSIPYRYKWNLSHAHTKAKASFSVCEYRLSTALKLLLAYHTTRCTPFCFCINTAPKPIGLASGITCVGAPCSKVWLPFPLFYPSLGPRLR